MDEERLIDLLIDLHAGLRRLGPGSEESTLQALALCQQLPSKPDILDIGCGSGAQTLVLASACQSQITATDLSASFLDQLAERAVQKHLDQYIHTQKADMQELSFTPESFDLLWSEGAIYNMGFDKGLSNWRPLVKPGGYLVVSELSWFKQNPPKELETYWQENYPAMRSVEQNLHAASNLGWVPVSHFPLPLTAWTLNYYGPLQKRIPVFLQAHNNDADAQAVVAMTEQEIACMNRYPDYYGYEFYVLRRIDSLELN